MGGLRSRVWGSEMCTLAAVWMWGCFLICKSTVSSPVLRGGLGLVECACIHVHP